MFFRKSKKAPVNKISPSSGEIEEAKSHPNGYVYRIDNRYDVNGRVPPYAIVGAWTVNAEGIIQPPFQKNDKFDEVKIATCEFRKS